MIQKLFLATKAFIMHNGKVLLLRESKKYVDGSNAEKFDVVGGRLEPGQHFKESLTREILEETSLSVRIGMPFFVNEWRPVMRGEEWQIVGVFFECRADTNIVTLSKDHSEYLWIHPHEYKNHPVIDNLYPAFEAFLSR